ncbi:MAG: CotH kinase family protein, partial [Bacteroidota bacterium]
SIGVTFDESHNNTLTPLVQPANQLPRHDLSQLLTIRLRNSGNDFFHTMIKDMAYTQLAIDAGLDLELSYYAGATQVFVNGEWLGMLNLRTESTLNGVAPLVGASPEALSFFRVDNKNGNLEFREGDASYGERLEQAIKAEDSDVIWEMVDVSNFLDYVIFQDYVGNFDWPHNNARAYSVQGAPLRFVLFDLDLVAYQNKNHKLPELEYVSEDIGKIYRALRNRDTEAWDERVKNRQRDLYASFSPEHFNQTVDHLAKAIEKEIPYQIARYGAPKSTLHWRQELDLLKREFEKRDQFARRKYNL